MSSFSDIHNIIPCFKAILAHKKVIIDQLMEEPRNDERNLRDVSEFVEYHTTESVYKTIASVYGDKA